MPAGTSTGTDANAMIGSASCVSKFVATSSTKFRSFQWMPSSPETIDPPETLEIRSRRASSPSSLSRRSAPTWNSIAREPPPERHSPDVPGSGGCFLSLGTKWTGHVAASPVTSMSCEPPRVVSSTIESPPEPRSPFTLTRSSQPRGHPDDVQARAHRGILTKGARLAEPPSTSHHRVAHDQRVGCGSHRPGRHVRRVSGCQPRPPRPTAPTPTGRPRSRVGRSGSTRARRAATTSGTTPRAGTSGSPTPAPGRSSSRARSSRVPR